MERAVAHAVEGLVSGSESNASALLEERRRAMLTHAAASARDLCARDTLGFRTILG